MDLSLVTMAYLKKLAVFASDQRGMNPLSFFRECGQPKSRFHQIGPYELPEGVSGRSCR